MMSSNPLFYQHPLSRPHKFFQVIDPRCQNRSEVAVASTIPQHIVEQQREIEMRRLDEEMWIVGQHQGQREMERIVHATGHARGGTNRTHGREAILTAHDIRMPQQSCASKHPYHPPHERIQSRY